MVVLACAALLKFRSGNQKPFAPADALPDEFIVVLGWHRMQDIRRLVVKKNAARPIGKERKKKLVTCLALVDRPSNKYWLIEATPDITVQLKNLQPFLPAKPDYSPDGIFLSHAHTGHYTGLLQLGREAMGANEIPVYVMPRMDSFLRNNGP